MFQTNVDEIKTHILCSVTFFPLFCEIMWKNFAERGRPQMTIWRMRVAYWTPEATKEHTYTHTGCVMLIAFPPQRLHERASMLRYTYSTLPV